ncbi:Cell division protein FtsZ [hydrothermal vent metagenome]|uniref:Cell division protein FtsZ n=1 Tax=hydrothermal vent metagenome TaxID=652676 RepID=A0A3B0TQG5_9ZZZZ
MSINLTIPDIQELKPRITVFGVGGAGGNAVNNMIDSGLEGVEFVVANTDAQALALSKSPRVVQLGVGVTEGLGAGSHPDVGKAAAEESIDEINDHLSGAHMAFITAGMGGGTGTGAAPVVARAAREQGILTVGVVTKPFQFEGNRRMKLAEDGIDELHRYVDTLLVIPNQNLFRVANEKTTFADAFGMADEVLYSGVACITDLMVKEGLINLDFADVRSVMRGMGKAMMGTGQADGEDRARHAAEAAISNPLLDDVSVKGARGLLISITGGQDMTLYELDEAASRIREEVGEDANIILGATFDDTLEGTIRVSVVATGTEATMVQAMDPVKPNPDRAAITLTRQPAEKTPTQTSKEVDEQLEVAMAAAVQSQTSEYNSESDGDVMVEPYVPEASIVQTEQEMAPAAERDTPKAYVPQSPKRPEGGRRMPRTNEFPAPGQQEVKAQHNPSGSGMNAPRALLKRLASNVGLNLRSSDRDEQPKETGHTSAAADLVAADLAAADLAAADDRDAMRAVEAPRPRQRGDRPEGASGNLDASGRAGTGATRTEQLEIPSFLRKHG